MRKIDTVSLMAKRPVADDDDEPIVRKRRYKPKKADNDDDERAPGARRGPQDEDDEDDEDNISTGNVYLDIALDFRDDCIDWAKAHIIYAIIICVISFCLFTVLSYLFIHSWVRYFNRPSLANVLKVYDQGLFPETKLLADYALEYISPAKTELRAAFAFLQGAALCAIAERVVPADKSEYYLIAANYLKESAAYGFLPERAAEGWFFLGKSLFHCGELEKCRTPLEIALEDGYPHTKEVYWYLAHAYLLGTSPDAQRVRQYLLRYQAEPSALEEEIDESRLLEAIVDMQTVGIAAAEKTFANVPRFEQFALLSNFVEGQIEFFKARELRQKAIVLETAPNPGMLLKPAPAIAPVMVEPQPPKQPSVVPTQHNDAQPAEIPTALIPVTPMDEAALRQFMIHSGADGRPETAAVVGLYDDTSEFQQRLAEMRTKYADNTVAGNTAADNTAEDEIIVLPKKDEKNPPEPPPPPSPPDIVIDPFGGDPFLKQAKEYRDQAAEHYLKAIALFAEVINLADANAPWGRIARLLTGISYAEMEAPKKADVIFRGLVEAFPASSEAAVAGFMLAERDKTLGDTDAALRSFALTFENLRQNPNYVSFWMPKETIIQRCEAMVRSDIEKQNFSFALQLLDMLNGVMSPEDITKLQGETYESWAGMLQSQADTTFGERGNQLAKEAEQKWRNAGTAFAAHAQIRSDQRDFSDLLWRGAEDYRLGKDYRRAIVEYKKYIRANLTGHRPEVHLRLGEMYLNLDFPEEAAHVLEEALHDYPTHNLVPQIRLVLSHVYCQRKEWDKAKALLRLNLISDATPASAPYRDSIYELGRISFEQGDLMSAIPYLEDAIKIHPEAIQAAEANYSLAQAYLNRGDDQLGELVQNPPESLRQSIQSIAQTDRQRALFYLEQTERLLTDRQRALGLTEAERLMLRNVHFMTCSTLIKMEKYEQVIPRLGTIATMYQDRSEALDALLSMAYAQRMVGKDTEAQTTLRQAEVILKQLEKIGTIPDGTRWRDAIQKQKRP